MECPACETENRDGARFCNQCGVTLELACPACRSINPLGSRFCDACGQELASKELARKAGSSTDAERKQVTALFSDLSGYTAMTSKLDPEDVKEITGRIFEHVREVITNYDGFIERFAGDGVLALFGVPKAHEDDPIRAIRAARQIHELVEAMNPRYERIVGASLSMHSGINTGLAVTADVDPQKGTHGVTGDSINIASRLSDLAQAGEIFVGQETYRIAEGHFTFQPLERAKVKGKAEPISMYKVVSVKEEPTKVHRPSGLRAELIGRKAELSQLQEAVERLEQGKGSVITICGDAGTGKSRLVEEFKASLDLSKIRWREGHSYPYAQNIPYFPLMDLMNRAWKIEEGDPPAKVRQKIESGIERLIGTREDMVPYVGSLYSLSYPEIEDVSPEFWKSRLFAGIKAIVDALIQYAPTIFCFEDIHWSDPSFLDLLRFLLTQQKYPALFICVHRLPFSLFSAHQMGVLGLSYEEIRLTDLSPSDTLDMVGSLLRAESIPVGLRTFIQKRVEGNPFYVEEAINSLVESETLARDNGSWKLTRPLSEADIPQTVQGVISARLDRLEKEMKRVLQEASVIGRAFLHEILKRVTALQDSLDRSLRGLEMLDLLRVRSVQPDLEYIFKHALTQEVVYNGLLKKDRREMHQRIGLVMEQLFQDRLSEFYEALAFHFKQGRSTEKAVHYLMKAGEKSMKRFALEESHQYYRDAYDLLCTKPDRGNEEDELLVDLILEWGTVFYYTGHFKIYIDILQSHEPLVMSLRDKVRVGKFYNWLGWSHCWRADFPAAHRVLSKALELGEETHNQEVIGYACTYLCWTCAELGLFDDCMAFGQRAQDMAKLIKTDQYLHIKSLAGMGHSYWWRGEWKKVLELCQTVLAYGERHSNIRSMVMGLVGIGSAHLTHGDFTSCIESCQKAINLTEDPSYVRYASFVQAYAYMSNGQLTEALDRAENVLNYSRDVGTAWYETLTDPVFGAVTVALGRATEGLEHLKHAKQAAFAKQRRGLYVLLEYILGHIYLQMALADETVTSAAETAEDHFNKAITYGEKIGVKGTLGQAYLDLGLLHKAKKRRKKARKCLSKAVEYFELCEVETFLKQARAELKSLG